MTLCQIDIIMTSNTFLYTRDFRQEALKLTEEIYQKKKEYELQKEQKEKLLEEKKEKDPQKRQAVHRYHKNIWGPEGFSIFEGNKFYSQDEVAKHGYCTYIESVHYECYDKFDPSLGDLHLCRNHKEKLDADQLAEIEKKRKEEDEALIGLVTDFMKKHLPKKQLSIPFRLNKKKLFANLI